MNLFEAFNCLTPGQLMSAYAPSYYFPGVGKNCDCPICNKGVQATKHFGWFNKGGYTSWKCFSSDIGGSMLDFVKVKTGITNTIVAMKDACDKCGVRYAEDEDLKKDVDPKLQEERQILEALATVFVKKYEKLGSHFYQDRGISEATIKNRKLGYCPKQFVVGGVTYSLLDYLKHSFPNVTLEMLEEIGIADDKGECIFADRFVMPYFDAYGRVIGWTGRLANYEEQAEQKYAKPKYKNSKNTDKFFNKERTLYNWDKASGCSTIYIVEGTMDALSLIEAGIPGVVATSGVALSNYHLAMLKDKKIVLALDNDMAGKQAMIRLVTKHKDIKFYVCILDEYKDFNEFLKHTDKPSNLKDFVLNDDNIIMAPHFVLRWFKENNSLVSPVNRENLWVMLANLIGSYPSKYKAKQYPQNDIYIPFERCLIWQEFLTMFNLTDEDIDKYIKSNSQKENNK